MITPFLWFDGQAEQAARFYVSVFGGRVDRVTKFPDSASAASGQPPGSVLTVEFELRGQRVVALNGGPTFQLSEAFSFSVDCEDQAEIDRLWGALTADGGSAQPCGWCKDKFGLSWQIVPKDLHRMTSDPDPKKVERMYGALLKMSKLDLAALQRAFDGR